MGQMVSLGRMVVQRILPYFIKNVTIYGTLWISSSIYHITLESDYKDSSSRGPHPTPIRGSQTRMKQQEDQHNSERECEVGDCVFVRLQPFEQMSLKKRKENKLALRYYGPYTVLQRIGSMAYKLGLPPSSRVHLVFHISCLNKVINDNKSIQTLVPQINEEGKIILEP